MVRSMVQEYKCRTAGKKSSKLKTTILSDAQRAAWAHAHYIINHGTNDDAKRFMTHLKNIKYTPADALKEIRKMAARRIPTWEEAAAAVFSSSSSEESMGRTTEAEPQAGIRQEWDTSADNNGITTAGTSNNLAPAALAHSAAEQHSNHTAPPSPNSKTTIGHEKTQSGKGYRTRSKTAETRAQAAATMAKRKVTPPTTPALKSKQPRKRDVSNRPSTRPKRVRIARSQIQGAGMGLYVEEDVRAGEWIARYSGEPLTQAECVRRPHSHYRLQVHKNLYLDAADKRHFEGRYINDARNSQFKTNARFAAGYTTNTCSATGLVWVRIYAKKSIKAGEEIFLNYGAAFWKGMQQHSVQTQHTSPAKDTTSTTNSTSSQSSSAWAAPAYIPGDTIDHDDSQHEKTITTQHNSSNTPTNSMTWMNLTPPPSSPMLLGHFKHPNQQHTLDTNHPVHHPPLHVTTPLSPITHRPSFNTKNHMNDTYSIQQMYELEDTILLPLNVHTPTNVSPQ